MNSLEILEEYRTNPANPSEEFSLYMAQMEKIKEEALFFEKQVKEIQNEYTEKTGDTTPFENNVIKTYWKNGYTRTNIDSKKLKEELPDVAKKYSKTTEVKGGWVWELK